MAQPLGTLSTGRRSRVLQSRGSLVQDGWGRQVVHTGVRTKTRCTCYDPRIGNTQVVLQSEYWPSLIEGCLNSFGGIKIIYRLNNDWWSIVINILQLIVGYYSSHIHLHYLILEIYWDRKKELSYFPTICWNMPSAVKYVIILCFIYMG